MKLCERCRTAVTAYQSQDIGFMVEHRRLLLAWGFGDLCCLPKNRLPD